MVSVPHSAAQDSNLVIGWTPIEPMYHLRSDGQPGGFSAELARKIAKTAQMDIEFRYFSTIGDLNESLLTGGTQLQVGMPVLPSMTGSHTFSSVVATSSTRLIVDADEPNKQQFTNPTDLNLGVLRQIEPQPDSELLKNNRSVPVDSVEAMIFRLLAGRVDGILAVEATAFSEARRAKLDHRLEPIGPPVHTVDWVITLHNDQRELIEPINDAIALLESTGELEGLRQRYFMSQPQPESDILRVGVLDFPPYHQMLTNGDATGFSIELLNELTELADLELQFMEISIAQWGQGPQSDTYDILPQVSFTEERAERMDFTLPIERASFSIITRAGEADGIGSIDDLNGRRVGVQAVSLVRSLVEQHEGLVPVVIDETESLLDVLLGEQVDAILYLTNPIVALAESKGVLDKIEVVEPPFYTSERSITLRPGLGKVRKKLDAAISLYLLTEDYHELRLKWFGSLPFWSKNRVFLAVAITAITIFSLIGYLIWQRIQRQHISAHNKLMNDHSHAQAQLIEKLERSNNELDRFAHIASHDLKEPLRGITINADYLKLENLSEKSAKRVDRMVFLCHRLEQLISDLLFYSSLGRKENVNEVVDLNRIVKEIRRSLTELLDERKGRIVIETELPKVLADKSKVRTVLQNLIINGLKYNVSAYREITIGYKNKEKSGDALSCNCFYIRDNGIGIAMKDHDRIFTIFSRLNTEKAYGAGTGAGLSFVRKIIDEYKCDISYVSEPGVGTTFYFSLPIADSHAHLEHKPMAISS